jgi:hypothetical protein
MRCKRRGYHQKNEGPGFKKRREVGKRSEASQ